MWSMRLTLMLIHIMHTASYRLCVCVPACTRPNHRVRMRNVMWHRLAHTLKPSSDVDVHVRRLSAKHYETDLRLSFDGIAKNFTIHSSSAHDVVSAVCNAVV
jgi:hypothetical protein